MSKELKKLIDEWKTEQNLPKDESFNFQLHDRELYSIQNAVRSVYEKEKESLTESERQEVMEILNVDLTYFI